MWQNPNEFRRIIGDIECAPTFLAPDGTTVRAASLIGNDILWQSMRWDAEVGLYDMRHRWYDPFLGRFLSRDPIGAFGDPLNFGNAYTFPANNPWSYRDPWGLSGEGDSNTRTWSEWFFDKIGGNRDTSAPTTIGQYIAEHERLRELGTTSLPRLAELSGKVTGGVAEGTIRTLFIPIDFPMTTAEVIDALSRGEVLEGVALSAGYVIPAAVGGGAVFLGVVKYSKGAGGELSEACAGIVKVGRQNPRNAVRARSSPERGIRLSPELSSKYGRDVVHFNDQGFADFSDFAQESVIIRMTGNNTTDQRLANRLTGRSKPPEEMIWHHHFDRQTMMLVPEDVHDFVKHTGGAAIVRAQQTQ